LPFANLARSSFIAMEILDSMIDKNIISTEIKEKFLQSIPSITKEMNNDLINLSKNKFLDKYGHLRPNTYDIMSKNYKEGYSKYFDLKNLQKIKTKKFNFDEQTKKIISKYLKLKNFPIKVNELIKFIKLSIEHRERSKLEFTKIINLIFEEIEIIIKRFKIKNEDKKFLDVFDIVRLYSEFKNNDIEAYIKTNIEKNKLNYEFNNSIELPNNIIKSNNIYLYEEKINSPSFITKNTVTDEIIFLDSKKL
jgi:hypothetical protein